MAFIGNGEAEEDFLPAMAPEMSPLMGSAENIDFDSMPLSELMIDMSSPLALPTVSF